MEIIQDLTVHIVYCLYLDKLETHGGMGKPKCIFINHAFQTHALLSDQQTARSSILKSLPIFLLKQWYTGYARV